MHKGLGFFAGGLASLVMLGAAQAKMVRYEINGQRYSYNTNNREQVEEARLRIAAANAAYAAWLKAEAERASNPLARVLGSPTQREAAEAQARLRHVLSSSPPAGPAAGSETGRGAAAAERMPVARESRARKPFPVSSRARSRSTSGNRIRWPRGRSRPLRWRRPKSLPHRRARRSAPGRSQHKKLARRRSGRSTSIPTPASRPP